MKIREIRAVGLRGATPEGGWSDEIQPDECVHTLVIVLTDEGITGIGSVFTNDELVRAALAVLEPLYRGENALEPERVSEKLHQHTFWLGRGGSITHAISGIDIALWDILGKATGQPVGRLLGGRYRERVRPYASLLMDEPEQMADALLPYKAQGFRAFKIGWGPFGRQSAAKDEAIVRAARDAVGDDVLLMVDAGGSDAYWHQGYKWALRTAGMLAGYGVTWFEEALKPDALREYVDAAGARAAADQRRRGADAPPILPAVAGSGRVRHRPARCHEGRRHLGGAAHRLDGAGARRPLHPARLEHRHRPRRRSATRLRLRRTPISSSTSPARPTWTPSSPRPWQLDADGMLAIPTTPGLGITLNPDAVRHYSRGEPFLD